jgi:hypothetical protein
VSFRPGAALLWFVAAFFARAGMRLILGPIFPGREIVVLPFVLAVLLWIGMDVVTGGQRIYRWLIAVAPSALLVLFSYYIGAVLHVMRCASHHACL